MTVPATPADNITHTGNDTSPGPFSFGFKIQNAEQLRVGIIDPSTQTFSLLTYATDYSVAGILNPSGGSVTLIGSVGGGSGDPANLGTGYKLVIRRNPPRSQTTDIKNLGEFNAKTHEDEFDKLTMIDQAQQYEIDRSVKLPDDVAPGTVNTTLPKPVGSERIGWDDSGLALTSYSDVVPPGSLTLSGGNGMMAKISASELTARSIAAGDGISVANGNGVSANPTITNADHANYLVTKLDVERMRPGFIRNLLLVYSTPTVVAINGGRCFSELLGGLYYEMNVSVAINVDLSASGANGLDTGAMAGDSWYYIWLIKNLSTGTVAGLASLSDTAPTLPAGYTAKRLIGAIRTDATPNIIPFYCRGYNAERKFYWPTPRLILSTGLIGPGGGAASLQPGAPPSVTLGAVYLDLKSQCAGIAAGAIGTMAIGCVGTSSMVFVDSIVQVAGTVSPVGQTALEMPNTFAAYLVYWNVGGGAGITQVSAYIACTAFEMEL